jgi:putative FmdB family regulatory protein
MPIYAYKCGSCGHAKDVLQKLSDAPLSVCPECSASTFTKQVTAAGFQLKGSGWYVTDFKGGPQAKGAPAEAQNKDKGSDSSAAGAEGAGADKSSTAAQSTDASGKATSSSASSASSAPSAASSTGSSGTASSASSSSTASTSSTSSTPSA